jgi:hypothetical protein
LLAHEIESTNQLNQLSARFNQVYQIMKNLFQTNRIGRIKKKLSQKPMFLPCQPNVKRLTSGPATSFSIVRLKHGYESVR